MKTLKKLFYFLLITCGVVLVLAVSCVSNIFLLGTGIYYSFKDTVSQMKDPTKLSAFNQKHNPQMAALGSISWITDDKHLWVNAQGQCECKFPPTDEVRTKSKCKCNAQDVKYIQKQVKESITIETPNRIAEAKKALENLKKLDQKITIQMKDPTKFFAFDQENNLLRKGPYWSTDSKTLWFNPKGQCVCTFPIINEVKPKSKCRCNIQDVKNIQKQVKESITIETPNRIAREKKRLENLRKIDQKIQSL